MELDQSGFMTQSPTVFAGNIGDNKYIVQVSKDSVRLLEGGKQLYRILANFNMLGLYQAVCITGITSK